MTLRIVEIGSIKVAAGCDAIGGDRRFLKVGLTHEIVGPGPDDGPCYFVLARTYRPHKR